MPLSRPLSYWRAPEVELLGLVGHGHCQQTWFAAARPCPPTTPAMSFVPAAVRPYTTPGPPLPCIAPAPVTTGPCTAPAPSKPHTTTPDAMVATATAHMAQVGSGLLRSSLGPQVSLAPFVCRAVLFPLTLEPLLESHRPSHSKSLLVMVFGDSSEQRLQWKGVGEWLLRMACH